MANDGINQMSDTTILETEAEILSFEVSDEALELAAATQKDKAGSFTLSFCSGLDTCPT
jgi:hypothetical protein